MKQQIKTTLFICLILYGLYLIINRLLELGVPVDYIGLGLVILQLLILLFVKSPYFKSYLEMREKHKQLNREYLGVK